MGLAQLNYKNSNPGFEKDLDYFHIQILVILSTHIRQLTSSFGISQLPKNTDESSFTHFIEHLVGVREISKSKPKQGRLSPNKK